MKRIVLIDADIELYYITQQNQIEADWGDGNITLSSDIEAAKLIFDEKIKGIVSKVDADEYIVCLTGEQNFRKTHFPTYKANRKATRKPLGYEVLKSYAKANHPHKIYDELEADDVMGIIMTKPHDSNIEYVIHSDDKDMWTIPGKLWCRKRKRIVINSRLEADRFLYTQILIGDVTDGYTGCPGVGKVKAAEVLNGCISEEQLRAATFKLYHKKYKDSDVASQEMLSQARQARILRSTDFDFKNKSVILWNPWEEHENNKTSKEVQH